MKSIYVSGYRNLVAHIRHVRIERNMTQAEAGRRVGRNRYWVSQIETRAVRLDVVQFVLLCRALGLRSSQVINRLEKEVSPEEGDLFLPIRSKRLEYRIWWPLGGHFLTAKRTY